MSQRKEHIDKFYSLIDELERVCAKKFLKESNGRMKWPEKGVYFFFESNEIRENNNPRIVRVGTHAISKGSQQTLWKRLRQHKGRTNGTGNHRSSVFRKLIGFALINKQKLDYAFWGEDKNEINEKIKTSEISLELEVSSIIGSMPFLYLQVPGDSKKNNDRAFIETNSISLLSNKNKTDIIDKASDNWLGLHSGNKNVIESGLWNSDDTEKSYDPLFLAKLEAFIEKMKNDNR